MLSTVKDCVRNVLRIEKNKKSKAFVEIDT